MLLNELFTSYGVAPLDITVHTTESLIIFRPIHLKFQVFVAINMKIMVLWNMAQCSLVCKSQGFTGKWCLNHQGTTTLKTRAEIIFVISVLIHKTTRSHSTPLSNSQAGGHLTPTSYFSHYRLKTLL
jgi:hypothetical protein